MNNDCLFCRIIDKELPSTIVHEDDLILAIHDIHPKAPVHILVLPKSHINSLSDTTERDDKVLGQLLSAVRIVAEKTGIARSGYKVVINNGADGGQIVPHLHLHVLGGQNVAGVT